MGADLYIESIFRPNYDKYMPLFKAAVVARDAASKDEVEKLQKRVSRYHDKMYSVGYFRDSYSASSVLWRLGLSWWKCEYIDSDSNITPENAAKFLAEISAKKLQPVTRQWLVDNHCQVDDNRNSPEAWNKSFVQHKRELCRFLRKAVELNESIRASV